MMCAHARGALYREGRSLRGEKRVEAGDRVGRVNIFAVRGLQHHRGIYQKSNANPIPQLSVLTL